MKNILDVKDLCKTYIIEKRQNHVLKNVNFSVEEGEMVAVMGPSGSGKSTLLYSVSGMDKATSGTVLFDGKDITALSDAEMADVRLDEMGFIFQQMYMMKNLTILDNILLPAMQSKKEGISKEEISNNKCLIINLVIHLELHLNNLISKEILIKINIVILLEILKII